MTLFACIANPKCMCYDKHKHDSASRQLDLQVSYRPTVWHMLAHILYTFAMKAPCIPGHNIEAGKTDLGEHSPPISLQHRRICQFATSI